jgi:hypothetical protein
MMTNIPVFQAAAASTSQSGPNIVPNGKPQFKTNSWCLPEFRFIKTYALVVFLQAAASSLLDGISDQAVNVSLRVEKEKLKMLNDGPEEGNSPNSLAQIPTTLSPVTKQLHLEPDVVNTTCFPACFSLYPKNGEYVWTIPNQCNAYFFSESKMYVKQMAKSSQDQCGQPLFHSPASQHERKPLKTFSHQSMRSWLARMM